MWSSRSRLQLPTQRSAMPFCQGDRKEVRLGIILVAFTAAITSIKLLIAIKDQVFVRRFKWKCLAQLLDDPTARRMLRDVEVQDAATIVADDEEAVEHSERDRWHREEIHGRNRFPMVAKEGQPALGLVRTSRRPLHPTGDGSLGKIKTEHSEFPMDPRCSPSWVLGDHLENQFPNLLRRLFPSNLPPDFGN